MTPKNNVKLVDWDSILLCPECGGMNLHHNKVEVWNRHEDDTTGQHVVIEKKAVQEDTDMAGNPSPRRHGLSIEFFCEYCSCDEKGNLGDKRYVLEIVQHKGSTYVSWKDLDDSDG